MLKYIAQRLLLVIPTFFLISLVVFLVLNLAPGSPITEGPDDSSGSAQQEEGKRILKEQFNLDKPVLLNTRPWLDTDQVRVWVELDAGLVAGATPGEILEARGALQDGGAYLVPHLVALLDEGDPRIRRAALPHLELSAREPFVNERRGDAEARREENRQIDARNRELKAVALPRDADEAQVAPAIAWWQAWYAREQDRYTWSAAQKLWILLTDTRFATYWVNLAHVDFGVSTGNRRPVADQLFEKLKYSVSLSTFSLCLAYLVAVPIGVFSAVRQGSRVDATVTLLLFIMYSLPTFFTGTVLIRLFTEGDPLALFPTQGFASMNADQMTTWERSLDVAWHLVLPVFTYTSVALASLSRYARSGVIDVIRADYIRTARAKGLSEPVVILKHAVRNGMIPILTLLGSLLPSLFAGSVVIEVVFNIPGMGRYLYDSINLRDYNAVMAVLMGSSLLSLMGILLSDLSYALVDPRISLD